MVGAAEENVGTLPPTFTGADVGCASEVEAAEPVEGVALLLARELEVGLFALQRFTTRFLGTTVGTTAGVSGTTLRAATA